MTRTCGETCRCATRPTCLVAAAAYLAPFYGFTLSVRTCLSACACSVHSASSHTNDLIVSSENRPLARANWGETGASRMLNLYYAMPTCAVLCWAERAVSYCAVSCCAGPPVAGSYCSAVALQPFATGMTHA